jgi:hypothetical protein
MGIGPQLVVVSGLSVGIPLVVGFRPQLVLSGLSVGIPLTVGFGPQLVVVSGLSVGIPLRVGFRPQLVVVSDLSVGIPLTVGFRLSRRPRLSRSPFTNFCFTQWTFGYHRAFSQTFLSYDGISAITEPFHELFFHMMDFWLSRGLFTNFSFTRWNFGYHRAFSRTFLSHDRISAITEPFHEFFFHTMEFTKCTNWRKTLFIYITKSIYTGPASLKTLPLDLEPPLQGKEYGPPYSKKIAKK